MTDSFEIKEVEAVTDAGPYEICPEITANYGKLVGLKIGVGWTREVQKRVGGVHGCTHLRELLKPMATTAARRSGYSSTPTYPAMGSVVRASRVRLARGRTCALPWRSSGRANFREAMSLLASFR